MERVGVGKSGRTSRQNAPSAPSRKREEIFRGERRKTRRGCTVEKKKITGRSKIQMGSNAGSRERPGARRVQRKQSSRLKL